MDHIANKLLIEGKIELQKYKKENDRKINLGLKHIQFFLEKLKGLSKNMAFRGEAYNFKDKCISTSFRDRNKIENFKTISKEVRVQRLIYETIELGKKSMLDETNVWRLFVRGRMFGLKSPFVDFTNNFFVALYFACKNPTVDVESLCGEEERDSDDKIIHVNSGRIYYVEKDMFESFDIDKKEMGHEKYDVLDFLKDSSIGKNLEISSRIDDTLKAQDAFLITWKQYEIEKGILRQFIVVEESWKENILLALDHIFHFNSSVLFPGFHGFFRQQHEVKEGEPPLNSESVHELIYEILKIIISRKKINVVDLIKIIKHKNVSDNEWDTVFLLSQGFVYLKEADGSNSEIFNVCINILKYFKQLEPKYDLERKRFLGIILCDFFEKTNPGNKSFYYWLSYFFLRYSFNSIHLSYSNCIAQLKEFCSASFVYFISLQENNIDSHILTRFGELLESLKSIGWGWGSCYVLNSLFSIYYLCMGNKELAIKYLELSKNICENRFDDSSFKYEVNTKIEEHFNKNPNN